MSEAPDWDRPVDIQNQTTSYFVKGMKTLRALTASAKKPILVVIILATILELMSLSMPLIVKELLDYLPTATTETFPPYAIALMAVMSLLWMSMLLLKRFIKEPMLLRALIRLENYWPVVALQKLLALSITYHERENTGRKVAKVTKGVDKIVAMLEDFFWALLPAMIYLILNAIVIAILDWRLCLIFILPLIPAVWLNLKSYKVFYPIWEAWEKKKEESIGRFCQTIINVRTVQSYVAEEREAHAHELVRRRMEELDLSACLKLQRYFFVMEVLLGLSFMTATIVGFYFAKHGWSTYGTVTYIVITGNATLQSLWNIIQMYTRILRNLVAAERMQDLLNEEADVRNEAPGVIPQAASNRLDFANVSLVHRGKEEPIFEGFDLTIEAGKMLAFVGKSGSGKSTLVNLLLRVYDPSSGAVLIGGTDVKSVDRDWYRRQFAYVPQEVEVFDGSIEENIVYAAPNASAEFIDKAVAAACLQEIVSDQGRFPLGLATQVGERGVRLSGGERQRIGIARAYIALLSGARVLVLDEATSSLDSQSEQVVQQFIEQLRRERAITIVAIAHRLSTIRSADRICVLDDGRIAETGTHEQLLKMNGLYQKLVALQQLGEIRE